MKWIKYDEGKWKLVSDDDPRPEDKDFASRKVESGGSFNTNIAPPWTEPLKDLNKHINDPDANTKIFEESQRLKEQWTKSGKWAKWERERKASAMRNKSEWIKRGATPEDREEATKG